MLASRQAFSCYASSFRFRQRQTSEPLQAHPRRVGPDDSTPGGCDNWIIDIVQ
jgi:hypothetical protein